MHVPRRLASLTVGILLALTGCNSDVPDTPPGIPLDSLAVMQIKGTPPVALPMWQPGADVAKYSTETLEFVRAAAVKAGVPKTPVPYAVYNGDPGLVVKCSVGNAGVAARDSRAARYCPALTPGGGILVLAPSGDWANQVPWVVQGGHPLHSLITAFVEYMEASDLGAEPQHRRACIQGLTYKGIVLLQPALKDQVEGYLLAAGASADGPRVNDAYHYGCNAAALPSPSR